MKTYKFEKTVYYGNNYTFDITLPNNFVFCEYMRYSEKQRFYFSVVKDPSEEIIALFKNVYPRTKFIGNLLIGILNNVMPLCKIPEISIDKVNKLYVEDLRKMYVVTECENSKYWYNQRALMQMYLTDNKKDVKNIFDSDEAKELLNKLESINPFYVESICRPIKFAKDGKNGPSIECDVVQFNSWLDCDKVVNQFQKTDIDITNWEETNYMGPHTKTTIYMNEDAEPWKEKFENRIKEITKTAFE